jgi:hypothetical protein
MPELDDSSGTAIGASAVPPRRRGLSGRRARRRAEQHYWDIFINRAPNDPLNQLIGPMRAAPQGSVNSVRSEAHSPEIMSEHVREIAKKFGSELVGIVALDPDRDRPPRVPEEAKFAVVCVVPAEYDPQSAAGIGGQIPVQNAYLVGFVLSAFFRESGYFSTMRTAPAPELGELAARAGLGVVDQDGHLRTTRYGTKAWVGDVIFTDFPLVATS